MNSAHRATFEEVCADGRRAQIERAIPVETPIAVEFNGIGYAVMMATPSDLEDYATGFALSEGLIESAADILSVEATEVEQGWLLRVQLPAERIEPVLTRARRRVSESSCGLCGMDNLDEVMRPLRKVAAKLDVADDAIFRALAALSDHQPLNAATGAAHAAAFCDATGEILVVREDVGRHNALDKLLGALARDNISPATGFILLSARCSFELVQKAVIANCPLLVTVSAATSLAVELAQKSGLRLISLARADSFRLLSP